MRTFTLAGPVDLLQTLGPLRHGFSDPTIRISGNEALRAARTPEGPSTLHLRIAGSRAEAQAWGPGADWALENAPDLLGANDRPEAFVTDHPLVGDLHRSRRGLRMCRSGGVVEALVPTILEQKITSQEARRSFRGLVHRYGEPAPGPGGLKLQPSPQKLASLAYWAFHPLGVPRTRAETIRRVCKVSERLEEISSLPSHEASRRLRSIAGVGEWTSAYVLSKALGDPDAVMVGDFHFPHIVTWALAGEPRGSDERMLDLLEQFRGQRGRALRLIVSAGIRPQATTNRRRIHHIHAH